jgi:hypothetical protein
MATQGKIPGPYVNDVPFTDGGTAGVMEYVASFSKLGIGARASGLPKGDMNGIKSLGNIGENASGNGRK